MESIETVMGMWEQVYLFEIRQFDSRYFINENNITVAPITTRITPVVWFGVLADVIYNTQRKKNSIIPR